MNKQTRNRESKVARALPPSGTRSALKGVEVKSSAFRQDEKVLTHKQKWQKRQTEARKWSQRNQDYGTHIDEYMKKVVPLPDIVILDDTYVHCRKRGTRVKYEQEYVIYEERVYSAHNPVVTPTGDMFKSYKSCISRHTKIEFVTVEQFTSRWFEYLL